MSGLPYNMVFVSRFSSAILIVLEFVHVCVLENIAQVVYKLSNF